LKVLITGADGQLGYELNTLLRPNHDVHAYDLDLDVTNREHVVSEIQKVQPDVVIHCAALTDVDGCEQDPTKAAAVNDQGTGNIVLACKQVNAIMVYVSTDFVFDGKTDRPYNEADIPNPINVYGKTKLAGENGVANGLDRFFIIRTSWMFGLHGKNFVKTILRLAREQGKLAVVDDQTGSPTYARDLAGKITELMKTDKYGLYHISNSGQTTWYGFACDILAMAGLDEIVIKATTSGDLNRPARRPTYSVLANTVLSDSGLAPMREYKNALADFLDAAGRCDFD
jgi:dTDP-4-dehydrorhamnose reductase